MKRLLYIMVLGSCLTACEKPATPGFTEGYISASFEVKSSCTYTRVDSLKYYTPRGVWFTVTEPELPWGVGPYYYFEGDTLKFEIYGEIANSRSEVLNLMEVNIIGSVIKDEPGSGETGTLREGEFFEPYLDTISINYQLETTPEEQLDTP